MPSETAPESADDVDPSTLPLPPYPPEVPSRVSQFYQQASDVFAFGERALTSRDVVRTWMPGRENYLLGHPDHLKRALLTDRETFGKSEDFRIAFGEGLVTVEGEEWRRQRDALQPLFTREAVTEYADGMTTQIHRRIDRWSDGERLDLQAEFTDLTLEVLFATVLGRELELDGDERLRRAAERLHGWFQPTSYVLPNWMPTPSRRRFRSGKEAIREEADRLLAEAAAGAPSDPADADDLLSLLVGIRESGGTDSAMLSDERLRDQMVTMVFAGHDTTTTTLTFACWALANNPSVRDRFHEEVDALGADPTVDDVADLGVTDRVITETLRLFPPVYVIPREVREETAVGGYRIPEGANVLLPVREIQRDGRFFEAPTQFRPGRWTGDLPRELHDFAYAPFGGGPRICIGRTFALIEAKLALATIGRRYRLEWCGTNAPSGEPPTDPGMTMRMEPGQRFEIVER